MEEKLRKLFEIFKEVVETISNAEEIKSNCNDMTIEGKTLMRERKLEQGRVTMLVSCIPRLCNENVCYSL